MEEVPRRRLSRRWRVTSDELVGWGGVDVNTFDEDAAASIVVVVVELIITVNLLVAEVPIGELEVAGVEAEGGHGTSCFHGVLHCCIVYMDDRSEELLSRMGLTRLG